MTVQDIQATIEDTEALKAITEAYGELSLLKIHRIRQNTEKARLFFQEINQIYMLINSMSRNKNQKMISNKVLKIMLTSNDRFYGHIDRTLVDFFITQLNLDIDDILVVGKSGRQILQTLRINNFHSLDTQKDLPNPKEMGMIVDTARKYETVLIYFAQFKTILNQVPVVFDLTSKPNSNQQDKSNLFIFEPEIERIYDFFDRQIKLSLLEQTFLEAELARTSSRLILMNESQQNAEKFLKSQNKMLNQAKKLVQNNNLLESLISLRRLYEHN